MQQMYMLFVLDINNGFCLLFFKGSTASTGTATITLPVTIRKYLVIGIIAQTLGRWARYDGATATTMSVASSTSTGSTASAFTGFVICTI